MSIVTVQEAVPEDGPELLEVQARCPMGTDLVVNTVNEPDFFARANGYPQYKIFTARIDSRIVGSAAAAVRKGMVGGREQTLGYAFQYFTDPRFRRQGVAGALHNAAEKYLKEHGAVLSYAMIMESNVPSQKLFSRMGYRAARPMTMPGMSVFKKMAGEAAPEVRPLTADDADQAAALLKQTWSTHQLYEPVTGSSLKGLIETAPGYAYENFLVMEREGTIRAVLGYFDWEAVMNVTLVSLSWKMYFFKALFAVMRLVRDLPPFLKAGTRMRQAMLTHAAYKDAEDIKKLVRCMNDLLLEKGKETMFYLGDPSDPLVSGFKGFVRIDTGVSLYIKPLQDGTDLISDPVHISGMDI